MSQALHGDFGTYALSVLDGGEAGVKKYPQLRMG